MRDRHMQMGRSMEDNRLFGGHSNPEQHWRPRMPLSSGEERLPRADRKWTLPGRPVAYIKVALSNVKYGCLYT